MVTILVNHSPVSIYTTHTVAAYNDSNDEYEAHRISNLLDCAEFIKEQEMKQKSDLLIMTGDLNNIPDSFEITYFLRRLNMFDSLAQKSYSIDTRTHAFCYKRLDYVLYKSENHSWSLNNSFLCFIKSTFEEELSKTGENVFYSDHYGVYAEFVRKTNDESPSSDITTERAFPNNNSGTINDCIFVIDKQISRGKKRRFLHLTRSSIGLIIGVLLYCIPVYKFLVPVKASLVFLSLFISSTLFFYSVIFKQGELKVIEKSKIKMQEELSKLDQEQ